MIFSERRVEVARFYTEIAGLSAEASSDTTWLEGENAKLAVHDPWDERTELEVRTQRAFVVWFAVNVVGEVFERAGAAGCIVGAFHGDYFFARDPEGRYIAFYQSEEHGHGHQH